ncbi:cytochrome P450 [Bisporella sp. PMI_857]|nr:cytochrome P450 [Bisporella sp. PMI_857]
MWTQIFQSVLGIIFIIATYAVGAVIHYRFFHSLSQFPGPLVASFTNLWKIYQIYQGKFEYTLLDLHRKYGNVVRIGPNHVDVSDGTALKDIYGTSNSFPKSSYYNAFTGMRPNIFGSRDEVIHSARRKAVAPSFSSQSVRSFEIFMDKCMLKLTQQLDEAAMQNKVVDLKQWIAFFVVDVLGELAFSRSFEMLEKGNQNEMPPIEEHVFLATMAGQMPWAIPPINKIAQYIPVSSVRRLIKGRDKLLQMAIDSVNTRLEIESDRKDILGGLLDELRHGTDSRDRKLDIIDVQTEAFGYIIAGSHTTAASTAFLLWHLLHNPTILDKVRKEIDSIPGLRLNPSYPFEASQHLPYLQATITEGFRINPIFVMPLMRVVPDGGRHIAGQFIPAGTDISICNYALHHDEAIFGDNLESFNPDRWLEKGYNKQAFLMHFGGGNRACLGKNIARVEMQKLIVSLLRRYDITLVKKLAHEEPRIAPTRSYGLANLEGGLIVQLKVRK